MTRRRIIGGLALLAGLAAAIWFFGFRTADESQRFTSVAASRGDLTEEISANGTINPVRVVNVGSQVSGTVQKLYVDYNSRVTEGQVLLELDPRLFRARLDQSEASLANTRAQSALADANARRAAELRKQDFISQQDYEQAVATARSSAAQVRSAQASVEQDRANLGFSIIRAPVSGVVINRKIDLGQTVAASFQTPELFSIAQDLTRMRIEALVAEADVSRVKVGQPVVFTVDAYNAREFAGTVSQVRLNPSTQQNVVTFTVVVDVPNPDGALLPGMTVNARFLVEQHRNQLLVPNAAMTWKPKDWNRQQAEADQPGGNGGGKGGGRGGSRDDGFSTTIFVLGPDNKPQPRRIRLGAADNDNSIVLGGALKAGDKVITAEADPEADASSSGRPSGRPPGA
ncbi:MAG: efflux RND transporter periplasmic adaptor subunit [Sandaracinobacteroides sp.]